MTESGNAMRVIVSGAFRAAYLELIAAFEQASGHAVDTAFGGSMGTAPTAIPMRLKNGEAADLVILAAEALDPLIEQGLIRAGSRVDLVRSGIGVAVRAGAKVPDIGTVDAFKRTLLDARSIAFSTSASGVYVTGLFQRLGIADAIRARLKQSQGEPVGAVVARGDAEIGFQQLSELLPVINSFKDKHIALTAISTDTFARLQQYFKAYVEDILGLKGETNYDNGKLSGVMQLLIDIRKDARSRKDFATSDKIRNQLQQLGISLKDEKDGGVSYSFS